MKNSNKKEEVDLLFLARGGRQPQVFTLDGRMDLEICFGDDRPSHGHPCIYIKINGHDPLLVSLAGYVVN